MNRYVFILLLLFLVIPLLAIAQTVTPLPASDLGVGVINSISAWLGAHAGWIVTAGAFIYDVIVRLIPTAKRWNILSMGGKLFRAIGALFFLLSDIWSKVIPDVQAAPPSTPPVDPAK